MEGKNYKDGFTSYGSEWFWDTNSNFESLVENVEWVIKNSYKQEINGYSYLHL